MNGIKRLAMVWLLLGSVYTGTAQDEKPADEARAMLSKLTKFYRSMDQVACKGELVVAVGPPGAVQIVQSLRQEVKFKRPGQYYLSSVGEGAFLSTPSVFLDAGKATVQIDEKHAIQVDAIETVPALFRSPQLGYNEEAAGNVILDQNLALAFLNKLLFEKLGKDWESDLAGVRLMGSEKSGELEAYRLVLSTETEQFGKPAKMDLTIWIQKGEKPFLLALQPDLSQVLPKEEGQEEMEVQMLCRWSDWNVSPKFDEKAFHMPSSNEDLSIHPSVEAMMHAQTADDNPALTLTGAPAPAFDFPLLDGGKVTMESLKGKVVVLGFWAAMLGESDYLGVLQRAHEKLQGSDVQVLAVNLGDAPEDASAYLKGGKWKVPVALDAQQSMLDSYKVRSIPQTVVVGKDGEILQVHVGTDAAFEDELMEGLTRLADDKDLAPAPPEPDVE